MRVVIKNVSPAYQNTFELHSSIPKYILRVKLMINVFNKRGGYYEK